MSALDDRADPANDAAAARLLAAPELAWRALLDRVRRDHRRTPVRVLRVLAALARTRTPDERDTLRYAIANLAGDTWAAPVFSMTSGGGELTVEQAAAYGDVVLEAATAIELAGFLGHANAAVRLAAARRLAAGGAQAVARDDAVATAALLAAVEQDPPAHSTFDCAPPGSFGMRVDVAVPLRTAAAAALVGREVPHTKWPKLLRFVLPHDDAALVARAVRSWGGVAARADLERIAADPRPAVAAAAQAVIAARGR